MWLMKAVFAAFKAVFECAIDPYCVIDFNFYCMIGCECVHVKQVVACPVTHPV